MWTRFFHFPARQKQQQQPRDTLNVFRPWVLWNSIFVYQNMKSALSWYQKQMESSGIFTHAIDLWIFPWFLLKIVCLFTLTTRKQKNLGQAFQIKSVEFKMSWMTFFLEILSRKNNQTSKDGCWSEFQSCIFRF